MGPPAGGTRAGGAPCNFACRVTALGDWGVLVTRLGRDDLGRAVKILDINLRKDCYSPETIEGSLARADILKLNDQEARPRADFFGLPGDSLEGIAEGLLGRGRLSHVVVTLGARGVLAVSSRGERVYEPGYEVEVVDTCGSGDAFAAGFFHRLLEGGSLREACRLGNALGAMVAARAGATAPIAPAEIEAFGRSVRRRVVDSSLERLYHGAHG